MVDLATVQSVTIALLVVVGVFFLSIGTLGLLRLPNVYNRMHATSKPTTLGTATIFLAGFVEFGPGGAGLTSLVGIIFLFLTVPTGAHMIARAAQKTGIPFLGSVTWPTERDGAWRDENRRDDSGAKAGDGEETNDGKETDGDKETDGGEKSDNGNA